MKKIARFEKVSREQFVLGWMEAFNTGIGMYDAYDEVKLPKRATKGSAGYDFFAPAGFELAPGETILLPTGVRARMDEGWVLLLYPRSGLGFKYRLQLNNTVGVIDSDYFGAKNEGHIMLKLTNDSNEGRTLTVQPGDAVAQGVFMPYGITADDDADAQRVGGFGSTGA